MAVEQRENVIEREIHIDASPETVFEFFVDPEKLVRWKGRRAELEPQPGGTYRVMINKKTIVSGEYVEVERPRRVVFTWGWEGQEALSPGSSRVEISLEPDGEGTRVHLRHLGLPEEEMQIHAEGWDLYLGRLAELASGGDPGPEPLPETDE